MRVDQRRLDQICQRLFLLLRKLRAQVRNHPVVTSQNALLRPHRLQFLPADIGHLNFLSCSGAGVLYIHRRTVQPDLSCCSSLVQPAVVRSRRHHVLHGAPRHHSR